MTKAAKKPLDRFARPASERRKATPGILRRTVLADPGALEGAELVALADEVFRELDRDNEP